MFDDADLKRRLEGKLKANSALSHLQLQAEVHCFPNDNNFDLKVFHENVCTWMAVHRFQYSLLDDCASGITLKQYLFERVMIGWTMEAIEKKFGAYYDLEVIFPPVILNIFCLNPCFSLQLEYVELEAFEPEYISSQSQHCESCGRNCA